MQTRVITYFFLLISTLSFFYNNNALFAEVNPLIGVEIGDFGDENSNEQVLIIPLFDKFPTVTSLLARDVFDNLNTKPIENLRLNYIPIGPKAPQDGYELILQKYLIDTEYTTAIFVSITDTYIDDDTNSVKKKKKNKKQIAEQEQELENSLKERVDSSLLKYTVNIEVFHKANRVPASIVEISDSMKDILNAVTINFNNNDETTKLFEYVESSSKELNFSTLHIKNTSNINPEYILKVRKQKLAMSNTVPNTAYLLPGNYKIDVYQIFDDGDKKLEVKIGNFKGEFVNKENTVSINFVETSLKEFKKNRTVSDLYSQYLFSSEIFANMAYPTVVTESIVNRMYSDALFSYGLSMRFSPRKYVPMYVRARISNTNPDELFSNNYNLLSGDLALGLVINFLSHFDAYLGVGGGIVFSKDYTITAVDSLDNITSLYQLVGELGISYNFGALEAPQYYLGFFYEPALIYIPVSSSQITATSSSNNAGNSITEPNYFVSNISLAFGWRY